MSTSKSTSKKRPAASDVPSSFNEKWSMSFLERFADEWAKHQVLLPSYTELSCRSVSKDTMRAQNRARRAVCEWLELEQYSGCHLNFFTRFYKLLQEGVVKAGFASGEPWRAPTQEQALRCLPQWVRRVEPCIRALPAVILHAEGYLQNKSSSEITRHKYPPALPSLPTTNNGLMTKVQSILRARNTSLKGRAPRPCKTELLVTILKALWVHLRAEPCMRLALPAAAADLGLQQSRLADIWQRARAIALQKLRVASSLSDQSPPPPADITPADTLALHIALLYAPETHITETSIREREQVLLMTLLLSLVQNFSLHEDDAGLEQRWRTAAKAYADRGYCVGLVVLQRRWYELVRLTKGVLLRYWGQGGEPPPATCVWLADRFPALMTSPLPEWSDLVAQGKVYVEEPEVTLGEARAEEPWNPGTWNPDNDLQKDLNPHSDEDENDVMLIVNDCETINLASEDEDQITIGRYKDSTKKDICEKLDDELVKQLKDIAINEKKSNNDISESVKHGINSSSNVEMFKATDYVSETAPEKNNESSICAPLKTQSNTEEVQSSLLLLGQIDPSEVEAKIIFSDDDNDDDLNSDLHVASKDATNKNTEDMPLEKTSNVQENRVTDKIIAEELSSGVINDVLPNKIEADRQSHEQDSVTAIAPGPAICVTNEDDDKNIEIVIKNVDCEKPLELSLENFDNDIKPNIEVSGAEPDHSEQRLLVWSTNAETVYNDIAKFDVELSKTQFVGPKSAKMRRLMLEQNSEPKNLLDSAKSSKDTADTDSTEFFTDLKDVPNNHVGSVITCVGSSSTLESNTETVNSRDSHSDVMVISENEHESENDIDYRLVSECSSDKQKQLPNDRDKSKHNVEKFEKMLLPSNRPVPSHLKRSRAYMDILAKTMLFNRKAARLSECPSSEDEENLMTITNSKPKPTRTLAPCKVQLGKGQESEENDTVPTKRSRQSERMTVDVPRTGRGGDRQTDEKPLLPVEIHLKRIDRYSFWQKHAIGNASININKINIEPNNKPSTAEKRTRRIREPLAKRARYERRSVVTHSLSDYAKIKALDLRALSDAFVCAHVELLAQCWPVTVDISTPPELLAHYNVYDGKEYCKRRRYPVELADIDEVRRFNRTLLTARVRPLTAVYVSVAKNPPPEREAGTSGSSTTSGQSTPAPRNDGPDSAQESLTPAVQYSHTPGAQESLTPGALTSEALTAILDKIKEQRKRQQTQPPATKRYCCVARRHLALNQARVRMNIRKKQRPPSRIEDLHTAAGRKHAAMTCDCCCLEALRLAPSHEQLRKDLSLLNSSLAHLSTAPKSSSKASAAPRPPTPAKVAQEQIGAAEETRKNRRQYLLEKNREMKKRREEKKEERWRKKQQRKKDRMSTEDEYTEYMRQRTEYAKYFTLSNKHGGSSATVTAKPTGVNLFKKESYMDYVRRNNAKAKTRESGSKTNSSQNNTASNEVNNILVPEVKSLHLSKPNEMETIEIDDEADAPESVNNADKELQTKTQAPTPKTNAPQIKTPQAELKVSTTSAPATAKPTNIVIKLKSANNALQVMNSGPLRQPDTKVTQSNTATNVIRIKIVTEKVKSPQNVFPVMNSDRSILIKDISKDQANTVRIENIAQENRNEKKVSQSIVKDETEIIQIDDESDASENETNAPKTETLHTEPKVSQTETMATQIKTKAHETEIKTSETEIKVPQTKTKAPLTEITKAENRTNDETQDPEVINCGTKLIKDTIHFEDSNSNDSKYTEGNIRMFDTDSSEDNMTERKPEPRTDEKENTTFPNNRGVKESENGVDDDWNSDDDYHDRLEIDEDAEVSENDLQPDPAQNQSETNEIEQSFNRSTQGLSGMENTLLKYHINPSEITLKKIETEIESETVHKVQTQMIQTQVHSAACPTIVQVTETRIQSWERQTQPAPWLENKTQQIRNQIEATETQASLIRNTVQPIQSGTQLTETRPTDNLIKKNESSFQTITKKVIQVLPAGRLISKADTGMESIKKSTKLNLRAIQPKASPKSKTNGKAGLPRTFTATKTQNMTQAHAQTQNQQTVFSQNNKTQNSQNLIQYQSVLSQNFQVFNPQIQNMQGQNIQTQPAQILNPQHQNMQTPQTLRFLNPQTANMQTQNIQVLNPQAPNIQTQNLQFLNPQAQNLQGLNMQPQYINVQNFQATQQQLPTQHLPGQSIQAQSLQTQLGAQGVGGQGGIVLLQNPESPSHFFIQPIPQVANSLPQVANSLPQVANSLPPVANSLQQVSPMPFAQTPQPQIVTPNMPPVLRNFLPQPVQSSVAPSPLYSLSQMCSQAQIVSQIAPGQTATPLQSPSVYSFTQMRTQPQIVSQISSAATGTAPQTAPGVLDRVTVQKTVSTAAETKKQKKYSHVPVRIVSGKHFEQLPKNNSVLKTVKPMQANFNFDSRIQAVDPVSLTGKKGKFVNNYIVNQKVGEEEVFSCDSNDGNEFIIDKESSGSSSVTPRICGVASLAKDDASKVSPNAAKVSTSQTAGQPQKPASTSKFVPVFRKIAPRVTLRVKDVKTLLKPVVTEQGSLVLFRPGAGSKPTDGQETEEQEASEKPQKDDTTASANMPTPPFDVREFSTAPPTPVREFVERRGADSDLCILCIDMQFPLMKLRNRYLVVTDRRVPIIQPTYWTLAPHDRSSRLLFETEPAEAADPLSKAPDEFPLLWKRLTRAREHPMCCAQVWSVVSSMEGVCKLITANAKALGIYDCREGVVHRVTVGRWESAGEKQSFGLYCALAMEVVMDLVHRLNKYVWSNRQQWSIVAHPTFVRDVTSQDGDAPGASCDFTSTEPSCVVTKTESISVVTSAVPPSTGVTNNKTSSDVNSNKARSDYVNSNEASFDVAKTGPSSDVIKTEASSDVNSNKGSFNVTKTKPSSDVIKRDASSDVNSSEAISEVTSKKASSEVTKTELRSDLTSNKSSSEITSKESRSEIIKTDPRSEITSKESRSEIIKTDPRSEITSKERRPDVTSIKPNPGVTSTKASCDVIELDEISDVISVGSCDSDEPELVTDEQYR